ncbi:MAG: hypothetical protein JW862_12880, partial [Anaerolineales bacterium]|nr:hypothetical protein [Anaerolineales bacterium]
MSSIRLGKAVNLIIVAIFMTGLVFSMTPGSALAATIPGADYGGADLVPADGDVLSGTFTNVGTFWIQAGVTVFVDPGTPLSIQADTILIEGILDGSA